MIIDSHAHLLINDPGNYPVAPIGGVVRSSDLEAPITAEVMLESMRETRVDFALAVQRAHVFGYDNRYVIDSAERYCDRFAAVVMVNGAAEGSAEQVRKWVDGHGAKGIRFAAASRAVRDLDWLTSDNALLAWRTAADLNSTVCLHVTATLRLEVIAATDALAREFPDLPIVLDHLTNVTLDAARDDAGFDAPMLALGDRSNVYLKFSTINLRSLDAAARAHALHELARRFPADRIMWGSDVGQSPESYGDMVQMAREAVAGLDDADAALLLGGVVARFYALSTHVASASGR